MIEAGKPDQIKWGELSTFISIALVRIIAVVGPFGLAGFRRGLLAFFPIGLCGFGGVASIRRKAASRRCSVSCDE